MTTDYFVVLIETSSNQRTIFETNRLKENVGASELIHRVGTRYVLDAIRDTCPGIPLDGSAAADPRQLERMIDDTSGANLPFSATGSGGVEIVVATSGKALLITRGERLARAIIAGVTRRTVVASPGVVALGAFARLGTSDDGSIPDAIHAAIDEAHKKVAAVRARVPAIEARFPRLPFVSECASSGRPAQRWDRSRPEGARSAVIMARRDVADAARRRLETSIGKRPLADTIGGLEELGCRWSAVVHADGNGLGQVFLDFASRSQATTAREYLDRFRRFSLAIDRCTCEAAETALVEAFGPPGARKGDLPFVPLVLGGDDLTAVMDGTRALPFTAAFLSGFQERSRTSDAITSVVGASGLGAAAGIAIVKPHFPFHRAYELAEELSKSAKTAKSHAADGVFTALDFEVVFDTAGTDVDAMRHRRDPDHRTRLTYRPYIVNQPAAGNQAWLEARDYSKLIHAAELLATPPENVETERRQERLPRSQQHVLRHALQHGREIAQARLDEIKHRYGQDVWDALAPGGKLFESHTETNDDGHSVEVHRTMLLDALDVADLTSDAG